VKKESNVKKVGIIILSIVIVIAIMFGLSLLDLEWYKFFAPKRENVRRKVFKATRSYNEGKLQDLTKYRFEYMRSKDDAEKEAIASMIRHSFAEYDINKLPYELREFVREVMYK